VRKLDADRFTWLRGGINLPRKLIHRIGLLARRNQIRVASLSLVVGITIVSSMHSQELPRSNDLVLPMDAWACDDMKVHQVLGPQSPVGCDRLRLVKFAFVDFDRQSQENGEIVVMDAAAKHVLQIFQSLRQLGFPIAKAILMNRYDGNDDKSMADNNTSGFNDRTIVGSTTISLHAYGLAIDVNPVQNPYVVRTGAVLTLIPPAAADYVNRLDDRPWKKHRPGLVESVVDVFADNGFLIWGGYWDNPIDYQHFQVGRKFAERLARLTPGQAEAAFDDLVARYRGCRRASPPSVANDRTSCIVASDPTANDP